MDRKGFEMFVVGCGYKRTEGDSKVSYFESDHPTQSHPTIAVFEGVVSICNRDDSLIRINLSDIRLER